MLQLTGIAEFLKEITKEEGFEEIRVDIESIGKIAIVGFIDISMCQHN